MLHLCGNIAEEQKNENALREYRSPRVDYNFSRKLLRYICPFLEQREVFRRFEDYYTWSRWDKLLFLSPIPDLDELFECDDEGYSLSRGLENIKHTSEKPFVNFHPEESNTVGVHFLRHIFDVLRFRVIYESLGPVWNLGLYGRFVSFLVIGAFFTIV